MPVIAMKVASVESHPNADSLKIYWFEAPKYTNTQIVANLENVYEVDDLVYIALEGTVLKDGTKIKATKLRGVISYGMAMGKVDSDSIENGQDFSHKFCNVEVETNNAGFSMISWPDIESLHNIRRWLNKAELTPKIRYQAKVKIDGTNGSVQVRPDGSVAAQSRSNIIIPSKDNMGFATWVHQNKDYFAGLRGDRHLTFFGEWCGQGIQKRTAISQIGRKIFAIFAVQIGEMDAEFEIDPINIAKLLQLPGNSDVYVIPYHGSEIVFDFSNKEELQKSADYVNNMVEDVERVDPWVKSAFEIEGLGEGVVMYPQPDDGRISRETYSNYVFKAKGEKHKVVNTNKPAQINPEFVATIDEFVKLFNTEARLEQGVTVACNGEYDMKFMGAFLKWFTADVQKESKAELESAELKWKQVNKAVMTAARAWYNNKINEKI